MIGLLRWLLFGVWSLFIGTAQAQPPSHFQVHEAGEGEVVLILPGGPGFSAWNLLPIHRHLAQSHRALLMDMRGVGDHAHWPLPAGSLLAQWVEDIEAMRVAKGIEQWKLVGHSWGGLMALLYARAYPKSVKKLVLLNPVDPEKRGLADILYRISERQTQLFGSQQPLDLDALETESPPLTLQEASLRQITRVLPTYFLDMKQGQIYAQQFSAADLSPEINSRIWQDYDAMRFTLQDAGKLTQSLTFLECKDDILMPENLAGLQAYFPKMRVVLMEGCAHFPWVEQPREFYTRLDEMLGVSR
jgi:pimeloyl-ACP methyl ester carboxylesterase